MACHVQPWGKGFISGRPGLWVFYMEVNDMASWWWALTVYIFVIQLIFYLWSLFDFFLYVNRLTLFARLFIRQTPPAQCVVSPYKYVSHSCFASFALSTAQPSKHEWWLPAFPINLTWTYCMSRTGLPPINYTTHPKRSQHNVNAHSMPAAAIVHSTQQDGLADQGYKLATIYQDGRADSATSTDSGSPYNYLHDGLANSSGATPTNSSPASLPMRPCRMRSKYYSVTVGRRCGVFTGW